ncbi:hypothetical protein [Thermovenabulum gondwanense]|nr:hypothetical protein [Thermovenabulum gondwanense]
MNLSSFALKSRIYDGFQIIIAGICPIEEILETKRILNEIGRDFSAKGIKDGFELDYKLAKHFCNETPKNLFALGVSIFVPWIKEASGGIIGSPREKISSAQGIIENIGNNLSLIAFPGGPGIVIEGSIEKAMKILQFIEFNKTNNDLEKIYQIALNVMTESIPNAIIISDGCGINRTGCAAAITGNRIELYSLKDY